MTEARTGDIPRAIQDFAHVVLEMDSEKATETSPNESVVSVAHAIYRAADSPLPKVYLNRKLSRIKLGTPDLFEQIHDWMSRRAVANEFTRLRQRKAYEKWLAICERAKGGMPIPLSLDYPVGRPKADSPYFTTIQDAATAAFYWMVIKGVKQTTALRAASYLKLLRYGLPLSKMAQDNYTKLNEKELARCLKQVSGWFEKDTSGVFNEPYSLSVAGKNLLVDAYTSVRLTYQIPDGFKP